MFRTEKVYLYFVYQIFSWFIILFVCSCSALTMEKFHISDVDHTPLTDITFSIILHYCYQLKIFICKRSCSLVYVCARAFIVSHYHQNFIVFMKSFTKRQVVTIPVLCLRLPFRILQAKLSNEPGFFARSVVTIQ